MVCDECKKCFNYLVCEVGCYGSDKSCEHLQTEEENLMKKSTNV